MEKKKTKQRIINCDFEEAFCASYIGCVSIIEINYSHQSDHVMYNLR